jgi:hypothetical protein
MYILINSSYIEPIPSDTILIFLTYKIIRAALAL